MARFPNEPGWPDPARNMLVAEPSPKRLPAWDSVTMGESGGWKLAMKPESDT